MFLMTFLFTCFAFLVAIWIFLLKSRYNYFRDRGIPGPSPLFFFGHYHTIWSVESYSKLIQSWTKKFGSIYGLFGGTCPIYVVSDVDFLQEVYIKQFSSFHSHNLSFLLRMSKTRPLVSSDMIRWRRQRHVINPAFSPAKLKLMTPLVDQCVESLIQKVSEINKEKSNEFNIYLLYKRLTMDVICRCAFGIDTDMQNDINNEFLIKSEACFEKHVETIFLTKLSHLMPWITPVLTKLINGQLSLMHFLHHMAPSLFPNIVDTAPTMWLQAQVDNIIDARITSSETTKRNDVLQLLLDATTHGDEDKIEEDELHINEVKLNVFLFMVAGYETTATALAYCTYILATKSNIQQKLQAEVDELKGQNISYDSVTKLIYMDLFIREILRMFPGTVMGLTRRCNETTTVCGHTIEKGSVIQPDVYSVHYNSELWGPEDPNLFIPERHTTERHPLAFLAFGAGPRGCIGIRFAFMEMKMCLVHLLQTYTILPGEHLKEGFQIIDGFAIKPKAINIKLSKRF